jgi:hypothetical membrane protein
LAASGAALWIAAALGYLLLEAIAASRFDPGYSYARNYISDLGEPGHGTYEGRMIDSPPPELMNTAFYLQGISFFAGAVLLVRARGTTARLFRCLAAANAVGNILVGTVHGGPAATADGTHWVHATGAALAIVASNAAILAGRRSCGGREDRGGTALSPMSLRHWAL